MSIQYGYPQNTKHTVIAQPTVPDAIQPAQAIGNAINRIDEISNSLRVLKGLILGAKTDCQESPVQDVTCLNWVLLEGAGAIDRRVSEALSMIADLSDLLLRGREIDR